MGPVLQECLAISVFTRSLRCCRRTQKQMLWSLPAQMLAGIASVPRFVSLECEIVSQGFEYSIYNHSSPLFSLRRWYFPSWVLLMKSLRVLVQAGQHNYSWQRWLFLLSLSESGILSTQYKQKGCCHWRSGQGYLEGQTLLLRVASSAQHGSSMP